MAVRSVMNRHNCWLIHVKRVFNRTAGIQKIDVQKFHCCRSHTHWRCINDQHRRRTSSLLIPHRSLAQDVDERVPKLSEETSISERAEPKIIEKEDGQIVIDYYRGLPRITVPLPSRKEKCRFTLKPISNTVRDLTTMIQDEDRGIDRVVIHTKDGVRISSSCSIEVLLEEEEFYLSINDRTYRISTPPAVKKSFTKDDVEKLGDVRILIAQLYESLNVKEYHVHKEQELLSKLEKIQSLLDPLEEQRKLLEKRAEVRTSVLTWVGLGLMSVQFGILARLTWWEYSWDIMEPVTYFVTYGTAMATYAYFALTKQDYILPDVRDRQHLITLHKKARKVGFDLNRYNTLKDQLADVKMDLERLRDPLIPPHSAAKVSLYGSDAGDHFPQERKQQTVLDRAKNFITLLTGKFKKS